MIVQMKPKGWLKPGRHSLRRLDDLELRLMGDNIADQGMFNPIEALPDGEIVMGFHRWLASMAHERISEVPVRIVTEPLPPMQYRIRSLSENLKRKDLSLWAKFLECSGFRDDEPGITAKEIAAALNVDPSTITRYLCLDHCIEEVVQAVKDRRLGLKQVYEISKQPPERQKELLEAALKVKTAKPPKSEAGDAGTVPDGTRANKVKVILASGIVVTVGGKSLSLDDAISELSEAVNELKAAKKDKQTVQAFMEACRKRAQAGVKITGSVHSLTSQGVSNAK